MPYYNDKKLISFKTFGFFLGSGQYKKLLLVFFGTSYEKFFYSTLKKQLSWSMRDFFILQLHQQSSRNVRRLSFGKIYKFFSGWFILFFRPGARKFHLRIIRKKIFSEEYKKFLQGHFFLFLRFGAGKGARWPLY